MRKTQKRSALFCFDFFAQLINSRTIAQNAKNMFFKPFQCFFCEFRIILHYFPLRNSQKKKIHFYIFAHLMYSTCRAQFAKKEVFSKNIFAQLINFVVNSQNAKNKNRMRKKYMAGTIIILILNQFT